MSADSSLSLLASGLRTLLAQHIEDIDVSDVLIGTPRQAKDVATVGEQATMHALNLFFYRFEPGGYPSASLPGEPLYVRAHCLVTAFASKNGRGDGGSAGQNDLRLLGDAMRVLHEHPSLSLPGMGAEVTSVQIVPIGLSVHEINHIWSMMGAEVGYRPSAAYELALVPIPLANPVDRRPRVAEVRAEAVPRERLVPRDRRWRPRLCLADREDRAYALSVPLAERPATLALRIEGPAGERVLLRWRLLGDRSVGWTDGPSLAPLLLAEETSVLAVELPLAVAGQALVWAEPVDDPSRASDPVLVIQYGEARR